MSDVCFCEKSVAMVQCNGDLAKIWTRKYSGLCNLAINKLDF